MWVRELKYCELKKKENISHAIHWSSVTKQNDDAGDYGPHIIRKDIPRENCHTAA